MVTVSRLVSNMANDNMQGDMEVETTNPARSAYSNEINILMVKLNKICKSFYLWSDL